MRLLLFAAAVLSCLALLASCETDEREQDETETEQRTEQRRAPPESLDTPGVRATGDDQGNGQGSSPAAKEPPDQQITSDNAADLLPIVLDQLIEFDYGRAWTEVGEYGFATALELLAATDDDEYAGAGLSSYCVEEAAIPAVELVLRLYQWDPDSDRSTYATFADEPVGRVRFRFGTAPDATWRFWNLQWAGEHIRLADATNFLREAKRHNVLQVRVPLPGRTAHASFRLWPGLSTPIQPNLDWCGAY